MAPLRVLHLVGSAVSDELRDLSALYARDCLQATADPERYAPRIAYVTPDGVWRLPASLDDDAIAAARPTTAPDALAALGPVDLAVPQLFCLPGMTAYRGLLEALGIPYVGNGPLTMALGADKARARAVVAAAGVDVPEGEVLGPGDAPTLRPPVVVKPVDADNSAGVALVRSQDEYAQALADARRHARDVLVERYVPLGREVRVGVLEVPGGALQVLPLEEYAVDEARKPVRLAGDKLRRDGDDLALVAKDAEHAWIVPADDPLTEAAGAVATAAHRALGGRHYGLFDLRVDPDGRPWFLEASPYCSFAQQSVLCAMARAAGLDVPALFAHVVDLALAPGRSPA